MPEAASKDEQVPDGMIACIRSCSASMEKKCLIGGLDGIGLDDIARLGSSA